jgi:hypothetical protein
MGKNYGPKRPVGDLRQGLQDTGNGIGGHKRPAGIGKGGHKRPAGIGIGGHTRPVGDLRTKLNKCAHTGPPIWQTFAHGPDFIGLLNALHKCQIVSVIDGSNQPEPSGYPKRVTVIVASPTSVGRWKRWYGCNKVFFIMVPNPQAEDPAIGMVLQLLHGVKVYVHTGDTKEGEITLGGGAAVANGCNVTYFSKAHNSPLRTNKGVQKFQDRLRRKYAGNGGELTFVGFSATTPRA